MNIMILGTGAMACLFGGYLSENNSVWLLGRSEALAEKINAGGVRVKEQDGSVGLYRPRAACGPQGLPTADLMIVFVKAPATVTALEKYKALIGPDTYLMTLQNGAGHEEKLLRYADARHVVIGSTQHNSSVLEPGFVYHGGGGATGIGSPEPGGEAGLAALAACLSACGFACGVSANVRDQIWSKLFLNTAASSLSAVLQVPLGYILENSHARALMRRLAGEAVAVANAEGCGPFDAGAVTESIEAVLARSKDALPSIYADIRAGRPTEVDTISGYVVRTAGRLGVSVPCHETVVALIHAMEGRK